MDNEEIQGVKFSEFPSQTPSNSDEVVGLHSGDNARFSIANIVAAVRQGLANIFVPLTRTINGKGLSTDITLDSSDIDYDNTASGLTATDVQEAIDELAQGGGGGGGTAASVTYNNTTSGLTATNVQAAIDEVVDDLATPTSELIGSGHTLIRCGKLRILKIGGFYAGSATITIPVADRTTFATSGLATYNDNSEAHMTFGLVIVYPDGSIAYKNWRGYNASGSLSDVTNKWVNTPGVIWMTA